jgi:DNA-binding response OmpR family regulator
MSDERPDLFLWDVEGHLTPDFLERLSRVSRVVAHRPETPPKADLALFVTGGSWSDVLALAERFKQANPGSPVILQGALSSAPSVHEVFQAGVDVVVEPGDFASLYAAIATRLNPERAVS